MAKYTGMPNERQWQERFPGYRQQCQAEAAVKENNPAEPHRCRNPARTGMKVCRLHGGNRHPEVIKREEKRLQVTAGVAELGDAVALRESADWELHPIEHLLEELTRSAILVRLFGNELDSMGGSLTETFYGEGGQQREDVRALVKLYNDERDRHTRVAKMCLDAGVAERSMRIREEQAQGVATAIRGILSDLGVAQDERVPMVVRKHLQALSGVFGESAA